MIDSDGHSSVRIYECPSPDDCGFTAGGTAELLEHVNTEHAGEYQTQISDTEYMLVQFMQQ